MAMLAHAIGHRHHADDAGIGIGHDSVSQHTGEELTSQMKAGARHAKNDGADNIKQCMSRRRPRRSATLIQPKQR